MRKSFQRSLLLVLVSAASYTFVHAGGGDKKNQGFILQKYQKVSGMSLDKVLSHADRRSMVIAGDKIRTRIANFGSIGGPRDFNRPKIEWPAFSGRDYGYEFGPVVGARILNTLGDSVSMTEDGIQDGGSDKFEPDGHYMNTSNSNAFARSDDPTTWPSSWSGWLSDSTYAKPGQVLADLETMYVMTDQDSTGNFGNTNPLEKLTAAMKGLGVQVTARTYQYSNALAQNILFMTYTLKNMNSKPVPNMFFGSFSDGSVGGSDNFENNTTRTDMIDQGIVYTFATNGHGSTTIPEWQGVTPGWMGEVVLDYRGHDLYSFVCLNPPFPHDHCVKIRSVEVLHCDVMHSVLNPLVENPAYVGMPQGSCGLCITVKTINVVLILREMSRKYF